MKCYLEDKGNSFCIVDDLKETLANFKRSSFLFEEYSEKSYQGVRYTILNHKATFFNKVSVFKNDEIVFSMIDRIDDNVRIRGAEFSLKLNNKDIKGYNYTLYLGIRPIARIERNYCNSIRDFFLYIDDKLSEDLKKLVYILAVGLCIMERG